MNNNCPADSPDQGEVLRNEPGVVASSADSKVPGGISSSLKCKDISNCSTKSSGSGGCVSGSSPPRNVELPVPGPDAFDSLDRALEDLISLENMDNDILGVHSAGGSLVGVLGDWSRVEDAGAGTDGLKAMLGCVPIANNTFTAMQTGDPEALPPSNDVGLDGSKRDKAKKKEGPKSKKQTNRKDLYERQRRYRERKKNKAREVEAHLCECLAQVEALRQENKNIHWKNESLLMMHSYWDDSISRIGLGQPSCNSAKENANGQRMKIREEIMSFGLGAVLERIVEPFLDLKKEPDNYVVKKLALYVSSKWDRETREHCQMKIQSKLGTFLRQYYDATSEEERDEYARKMHILIQTRRRLADFMVQLHPEFVMERVLEGWVEKGFDPTLMGEDSIEIEQSCVSLLISKLKLSPSQIEEASMAWSHFVSAWNQEVEAHNIFVRNLEQGANWSSTYERGMHTGVQASLELRNATYKLEEKNKRKAMMILTLSNRLHSLLSPVQLAHLGTFYPAYTPNWVCVANVISRERAQLSA